MSKTNGKKERIKKTKPKPKPPKKPSTVKGRTAYA